MLSKLQLIPRTSYQLTCNTAIQAIHGASAFLRGYQVDLIDLMGYTGQAFRIQVDPLKARGAAVTAYEWGPVLAEGLRNAGLLCRYKGGPGCAAPSAELVVETVDLVQQSLDRGVPVIVWDLFLPEFGVMYGYDDDRSVFYGKDLYQNGVIKYEQLGGGRTGELFVLALTGAVAVNKAEALRDMLRKTLSHWEERGTCKPPEPFRAGTAGYAAWIEAFRSGHVEPSGNAYQIHQLHDAREYAVAFLCRLHDSWGDLTSRRDREIRILAGEAASYYAETVKALRKLRVMFPDPYGGEPNQARNTRTAIRLIRYMNAQEELAISRLSGLAECLGH